MRGRKEGDEEEKGTVTGLGTDGGWRLSEELCRLVRQKYGWKEPPIVLARRNADLMPALRKMGKTLIAIPWHDGASQMMEVLDRLVDIPLLVPPTYMRREQGKPLKDKSWIIAKIDKPEKAEQWRLTHQQYFKRDARKERAIEAMIGLWPQEVRIPE